MKNNYIIIFVAFLLVLSTFFLTKTFVSKGGNPRVTGRLESEVSSSGLVRVKDKALRKPLSAVKEKAIKKWIGNMETTPPPSTFQD